MWNEAVQETLSHIERLDREQKATSRDIPFWRVSADAGRLMHILVRTTRAARAVEVGTSSGYSGIHIAAALADTGGHLWTLDMEPYKIELAAAHFRRAGLEKIVTQVHGDALLTLPRLVEESPDPIDFAFLDAVKPDYIRYLRTIRPKLRSGSVVCADNVARQGAAVADYLREVGESPFVTAIVPTVNAEGDTDALAVSYVQ